MNLIKKTVIFTGYTCNNNCVFCTNSQKRTMPSRNTAEIINDMASARSRGRTYLELIGGEITIRKDALQLIAKAKELGFKVIAMATNGRMLSYPEYAQKIVSAGLTDIIFSVHGHNSRLHDSLTQVTGSFRQLVQGIKNIHDTGIARICANITIVKKNYRHLRNIGKFLLEQGIKDCEFIFVDPTYGGAHLNFYKQVPKISRAAPYIHNCLNLAQGRKDMNHWHIRYVPLCYFQDYRDKISELIEKRFFQTEVFAPDFTNLDATNSRAGNTRIKPAKCKACRYDDCCEGIWKDYLKYYGEKELKPVS